MHCLQRPIEFDSLAVKVFDFLNMSNKLKLILKEQTKKAEASSLSITLMGRWLNQEGLKQFNPLYRPFVTPAKSARA